MGLLDNEYTRGLESRIVALRREIHALESALRIEQTRLCCEYYKIKVGDIVIAYGVAGQHSAPAKIVSITPWAHNKPWLSVRIKLQNGEWGKREYMCYGKFETIDEDI